MWYSLLFVCSNIPFSSFYLEGKMNLGVLMKKRMIEDMGADRRKKEKKKIGIW